MQTAQEKALYDKSYYKNRLYFLRRYKQYRQTLSYAYNIYRSRAKFKGQLFSLTFKQFKSFWQKDCIAGCKIATIGLDRIDSAKGYTINNVRPMCGAHNVMKLNHTDRKAAQLAKSLYLALKEK